MRNLLVAALGLALIGGSPLGAESLRVMSFNVRLPSKSDGPNYWDSRRDIAVEMLRTRDPDIFGTQELFHHQGEYLVEKLPEYSWFGLSRRGNHTDEHMGVFYKKDKLRVIVERDFWLSETPDVPGSMSWDVSLPRMVTWGLFETKESGRRFYFLNTHFPHRRQDHEARLKCAGVIVSHIASLPPEVPLILTGDFNAPAGEAVYRILTSDLEDAWKTANSKSGPEGTFHGFTGKPGESRIDWILYRGPFEVLTAATVTFNEDGRYPSDHFPVFAVLELR